MSGDLAHGVVSGREKEWSLMSLIKSNRNKSSARCVKRLNFRAHIQVLKTLRNEDALIERLLLSDSDDHSSSRRWICLEGGVGGA